MVLLQRGLALAKFGIENHERAVDVLPQRVQGQQALGKNDRVLPGAVRALVRHQRVQGPGHQVVKAPAFILQPGLEAWVGKIQAVEKITSIERYRSFEVCRRAARDQVLER